MSKILKFRSNTFSIILVCGLLLCSAAFAEVDVGKMAPAFSGIDLDGKTRNLSEFKGKLVVLEWVNPDCPFVKKHYDSKNMQSLQTKYTQKGVVWLSINSSAPGKQGHLTSTSGKQMISTRGAKPTALILDPHGKIGKAYEAKTTPHMYVIDQTGKLVYAGAIDSKSSTDIADIPNSTNYVANALDELLSGKSVSVSNTRAYGCSVKYE